jgi:hypothetical protein
MKVGIVKAGKIVGTLTVSGGPYKAGDPAPHGYIDRQEWADIQAKAGLKQVRCNRCSRWNFPQQLARKVCEVSGVRVPICLECDAMLAARERKESSNG